MKTLSRRVISIFLCLSLLVNSFLPLVVYAQDFDPGGGGSYEEGSSDGGSYDYADSASTAETAPVEEPQEDASSFTPSGITPEFVDGSTPPQPTPAPVVEESDFTPPSGINPEFVDDSTPSEPAPDEVITDSTSQDRAFAEYASRAEAMDQYQDEVYANSRADESISGNTIIYLPSQITGMVQNQLDRVEEEINKIAENTTPMTREEVLQAQRLERKEEQLNKIAQQQDAALEAAEEERRQQLELAMNLTPEDRTAYLKETGIVPADTPAEQVDTRVRTAATGAGFEIDGSVVSGDFTISNIGFGCQLGSEDGCRNVSIADLQAVGEFGLDTVMQGTYYLGKEALNLQGDMDKVDRLLGETGLANRQQLSPISGPGSLAGGYGVTLIRLQELARDVDAHPDSSLTPEEQARRREYAEALRTLWEEQHQAAIDTAAAAAMTFVGAPLKIAKAGAAKVIPQSVQKAAGDAGSSAWNWVRGIFGTGTNNTQLSFRPGQEAAEDVQSAIIVRDQAVVGERADLITQQSSEVRNFVLNNRDWVSAQTDVLSPNKYSEFLQAASVAVDQYGVENAKSKIPLIQRLIAKGESPDAVPEILRTAEADKEQQARELYEFLQGKKSVKEAKAALMDDDSAIDLRQAWIAVEGSEGATSIKRVAGAKEEEGVAQIKDALLLQYERNAGVKAETIDEIKDTYRALIDSAVANGSDPAVFNKVSPEVIVDPRVINVYSREAFGRYVSENAAGFYTNDGIPQIGILRNFEGEVPLCLHECIHRAAQMSQGELDANVKERLLDQGFNASTVIKLDEGLTEWATQEARRLRGKGVDDGSGYTKIVKEIDNQLIPAIMTHSNVTENQARRIMTEAALVGKYQEMVEAAGGQQAVKAVMDQLATPRTSILSSNEVRISLGIGAAGAAGILGYSKLTAGSSAPSSETKDQNPKKSSWNIIKEVFAQDRSQPDQTGQALDVASAELLVKQKLIAKVLNEDGYVDADFVKDVVATDIIQPEVLQLNSGYLLTTGKAGTVEGDVNKNKYVVEVSAIPNLDIKIPSYIDLSAGDATLGIAIKEGTGKVETLGYVGKEAKGIVSKAYAEEASNSAKVKVVVFADNNGNGVIDDEEKALPWAGVSVKLTKVNEENTISLNAGWNLVSLTLLPNQTLTASTLLKEIKSQDGNATTVSTLVDGAWKSYVKRGENDYSMDDFAIEVGKAYFVKALKPSVFKYSGQNLVAPVKLKLNSGWNAVGLPKTSKEYKASTLINDIVKEGSASGTVAWWDSGLWDTFVRQKQEEYGNNFTILPNFGYIIKVEKEGEAVP